MVDIDTAPEGPYINRLTRASITTQSVPLLAELGLLPDLSAAFIQEKSKADNVAKTLAILQAGWLVFQCIARAAIHLPLTLLEINTLAHVVCTFIIYFLWWSKPLDIEDPRCFWQMESTLMRGLVDVWSDHGVQTRREQEHNPHEARDRRSALLGVASKSDECSPIERYDWW